MRKILTGLFALAALGVSTPLTAQEADLFTRLDANKDGFVSEDEVEGERKPLFERLLRTADENGDKKLSKEEFAKGTRRPDAPRPALAGEGPRPGFGPGGALPDPKEIISRLDKDGDGKISKDEAPERMKENFDRLDANKDGQIEAEEFVKAAAAFGPRPGAPGAPPAGAALDPKAAEEIFTKQDANSDGKITKDEIPEEHKESFQRMLDRQDSDGDGALTKEQFVRGFLAMQQRRPDGAPGTPPEGRPGFPGPGGMSPLPVLRALDADGDGEISKEEIEGASKALAALDQNGDGKLSRDEILPNFAGAFPGRPGEGRPNATSRPDRPEGRPDGRRPDARPEGRPDARPEGRPGTAAGRFNAEEFAKRLKEADKDGDGKISKEEAPDRLKENFDRIDANGDGQVDEAEIKQMIERMRDFGGGRRPEGGRPGARPEGGRPDGGRPDGGRPEGRPERNPEEKKD